MAACQPACSRSKESVPWSKLDRVLLICIFAGFSVFIVSARAINLVIASEMEFDTWKLGPQHGRKHGDATTQPSSAFMEETDCRVSDISEQSKAECARNERGEWCAAQPPSSRHVQRKDADSNEERDGEPSGLRPGHHGGVGNASQEEDQEPELPAKGVRQDPTTEARRHFPCMRMRVKICYREKTMEVMAYQDLSEAINFPRCSFSSCEEDPDVNRMRMEEMARQWEQQRHQPTRCLVNKDNPEHVIILRNHLNKREFITSCGFQLTFWAFVSGIVFFVALSLRRCRSKKTETKKVNPEKLPGGAYLVTNVPTDGMSDKEKEAFGFSVPVDSNSPVPVVPVAPKEFLMLAPPAYDMKSADMQAQPPAYDVSPEKQV